MVSDAGTRCAVGQPLPAFVVCSRSLSLTMRLLRSLSVCAVATAAACSSSTDVRPPTDAPIAGNTLTGVWQTDRELIETYPGSRQTTIVFDAHGAMTTDSREFGVFPGDATDDVSSLSHTAATFSVTADSVRIQPTQVRYWTHLEGMSPPEHVFDVTPPSLGEVRQFEINHGQLIMHVVSPKEGPIIVYHRAG